MSEEHGAGGGEPADPPGSTRADDPAAGQASQADQAPGGAVRTTRGRRRARRKRSAWRELPILIILALAIALLIKNFAVQAFYIPSSSMEDTLLIGDKILVNKVVYHLRSIQRGDIIVFNGVGSWDANPPPAPPASNFIVKAYDVTLRPLFHSIADLFGTPVGQTDYVKRVIGVPGDHVACCNSHGQVTVNGVALHERSYLYPGAAPSAIHFSVTVPPGRLWVMGDNRAVSDDSRLRQDKPGHGTILESKVVGRAFVIVWPPGQWRILPIPSTFGQPGISRAAAARGGIDAGINGAGLALRASPEPPYLPLAGGFACAVPLTLLQRRVRRYLARRRRGADLH
jgi:signal peptidase I